MGLFQPGNAPALQIDQDRRVGAAQAVTQIRNQGAGLRRVLAIALEQDEAEGLRFGEETPLGVRQTGAGAAEDYGFDE